MNKSQKLFSIFKEKYGIDFRNHVRTRKRFFIEKNQMLQYLLYKYTKNSLQEVGNLYKYPYDHATVLHSCKATEAMMDDPTRKHLKKDFEEIREIFLNSEPTKQELLEEIMFHQKSVSALLKKMDTEFEEVAA